MHPCAMQSDFRRSNNLNELLRLVRVNGMLLGDEMHLLKKAYRATVVVSST